MVHIKFGSIFLFKKCRFLFKKNIHNKSKLITHILCWFCFKLPQLKSYCLQKNFHQQWTSKCFHFLACEVLKSRKKGCKNEELQTKVQNMSRNTVLRLSQFFHTYCGQFWGVRGNQSIYTENNLSSVGKPNFSIPWSIYKGGIRTWALSQLVKVHPFKLT